MSVLYKSDVARGRIWARVFAERASDLDFHIWPDCGAPESVEYLVAWEPPPQWSTTFPNVKVLFSSGAGVDQLDLSAVPEGIQVARMVEPGIIQGVVEYVTMSVLMLHRRMPDYLRQQSNSVWQGAPSVPAASCNVGVMGLGVLGQAVLERLNVFDYSCYGWSRSRKSVAGCITFAGEENLEAFLACCDILVCLLPLTEATRGILGKRVFSALPAGAALINAGRGAHLDESALLDALDSGRLSQAILDVTEPEPLPPSHRFWSHPRIMLTPHIAGSTRPESAALVLIDNIRRHQRGERLLDAVDRDRGY
jgi:glyoxylate/hydroxypyruvate reductase A